MTNMERDSVRFYVFDRETNKRVGWDHPTEDGAETRCDKLNAEAGFQKYGYDYYIARPEVALDV